MGNQARTPWRGFHVPGIGPTKPKIFKARNKTETDARFNLDEA
jgi:hypothetical protein